MILPCESTGGCGTLTPDTQREKNIQFQISRKGENLNMEAIPYYKMTPYMPDDSNGAVANTPDNKTESTLTKITTGSGVAAAGIDVPKASLPSQESVFQNSPTFAVPTNPLLPPGYQEILDYGNLQYLNGFLRTQIGKYVRVQQLIGSNIIEERYGYLVGVGINYILLQEISTDNIFAIDFYNIKYVYIYFTKPDLPTNGTY